MSALSVSGEACRVFAPAKVNLGLRILGRRDDGYHELETVMLLIDLCDVLWARATTTGSVELDLSGVALTADIPSDERNLVWRIATEALARGRDLGVLGQEVGVALRLEKSIPSRAGLGGGSSDAAATLRALERALDIDLGAGWRREVLAKAGADCVFFHDVGTSGAALCTGVGQLISPIPGPAPPWWVLVLTPAVECSTAEIFAARVASPAAALSSNAALLSTPAGELREALNNDLEPAALSVVPALRVWRELLDEQGLAHARLTGSGSSFFALFDSEHEARAALAGLERAAGARERTWRLARVCRAGAQNCS